MIDEEEILELEEAFHHHEVSTRLCRSPKELRADSPHKPNDRQKVAQSRTRLRYSLEPSEEVAELLFPVAENGLEVAGSAEKKKKTLTPFQIRTQQERQRKKDDAATIKWQQDKRKAWLAMEEAKASSMENVVRGRRSFAEWRLYVAKERSRRKNKVTARKAQVQKLRSAYQVSVDIELGFDYDVATPRVAHYSGAHGKNIQHLARRLKEDGIEVVLDDTLLSLVLASDSRPALELALNRMAHGAKLKSGNGPLLFFDPIPFELEQMKKPVFKVRKQDAPAAEMAVGPSIPAEAMELVASA